MSLFFPIFRVKHFLVHSITFPWTNPVFYYYNQFPPDPLLISCSEPLPSFTKLKQMLMSGFQASSFIYLLSILNTTLNVELSQIMSWLSLSIPLNGFPSNYELKPAGFGVTYWCLLTNFSPPSCLPSCSACVQTDKKVGMPSPRN